MAVTISFASPVLHFSPSSRRFLKNSRIRNRNQVRIIAQAEGKPSENECWGDIVDRNMILLRKRIKDLRMEEGRTEPPAEWMEWEKRYYVNGGYNEDVYGAVGVLQNYLMSIRPGLGVGSVVLVVLSMLMSSGMVLSYFIELVKSV